MLFWTIAGLASLAVFALLLLSLVQGADSTEDEAAFDMQVYRDQLAEVDRDVARGVLSAADAERTRIEVSRKLLAADKASNQSLRAQKQSRSSVLTGGAIAAVILVVVGFGAYAWLGQPGSLDQPLDLRLAEARAFADTRETQAEFEAANPFPKPQEQNPDLLNLVKQLRDVVAEREDDLQGYLLLARNEASLGNYPQAYRAQERIIELKGDEADLNDFLTLADYYMIAAQGYISPEAEAALGRAYEMDPSNGFVRYYRGLLMMQTGRPDLTFYQWRELLEEGPETAPWIAPIRANIDDLAWFAAVRYEQPALRGPTAEDMANAENIAPEDRAAMIEGMVANLSDRLANEGGSASEWAQLITALGVLGRFEEAQAIFSEAQGVFEGAPSALDIITQAARGQGLIGEGLINE